MRGSITVFFALTLSATMMLLFGLVEGGRVAGGKACAKLEDAVGVESVFAEYDKELMERYGLWAIYGSYGAEAFDAALVGGRLVDKLKKNATGHALLASAVDSVELKEYCLLTDANANEYVRQAVELEKLRLGVKGIQSVKEALVGGSSNLEELSPEEMFENAENAKERADLARQSPDDGGQGSNSSRLPEPNMAREEAEGIFSFLRQLQKRGVLGLVLNIDDSISTKGISNCYSMRSELQVGSAEEEAGPSAVDGLVFREYLLDYFGAYGSLKENSAMDYEVEYILVGKLTDEENLKAVVHRLLLTREAINMAYLLTDAQKQEEAEAVALAIGAITGNAYIVEAIKYGILAGWAYAESICEVRDLLHGGRAELVKNAENWRTDLLHLTESMSGTTKGKRGMSYHDYLRVFLEIERNENCVSKSLDLIEKNLLLKEYHSNFRVDYCMCKATFTVSRSMKPKFFVFTGNRWSAYQITDTLTYQYQ